MVVPLKPEDGSEHARRNRECADRLAAELGERCSLLLVRLAPGLHRSRVRGLLCNIRDLPGVERVADASQLPFEVAEALLQGVRS